MNAVEEDNLHRVVIGIGSNIEPKKNIPLAVANLSRLSQILAISRVYQTSPVGGVGPDFLNAAAVVETGLATSRLRLAVLRRIESDLGRNRGVDPNTPRTIDLDILIYDGNILDQNLWTLAHLCVPVSDLLPLFEDSAQNKFLKNRAEELYASSKIIPVPLEFHWR